MAEKKTNMQGIRYALWEKRVDRLLTPIDHFIHRETTSGLLMMVAAIVAMILANSALAHTYEHWLHTKLTIKLADFELTYSLHHWINDGLMALFFFVVGLEIKREIVVGELAQPRQAALPIIAAIGGMVVPAVIYAGFNAGQPGEAGWGVPMATDIAFAVGVLALLGDRVPKALMTFLMALAIVDDLGAVAVIAVFYTEDINTLALAYAGLAWLVLLAATLAGIRHPVPLFLIGCVMWVAMLKSGVHATVAGILAAWTVPSQAKFSSVSFIQKMRKTLNHFERSNEQVGSDTVHTAEQRGMILALEQRTQLVQSPLQRLEHGMHMPVALVIIPLFALANAGVPIDLATLPQMYAQPTTLGVMLGLVVGKIIGVAGVTLLAIRLGLGELPPGCSNSQILGVGMLAGIGFTMSIFVAELAFKGQTEMLVQAKAGVLTASLIAGVAGYLWLRFVAKSAQP